MAKLIKRELSQVICLQLKGSVVYKAGGRRY